MPCFHPLRAFKTSAGEVVFYESSRFDIVKTLDLPCGQCVGCRLERSRQWAMRCLHESSLYPFNVFCTLTYSDEHLPRNGSLEYSHFQKFMKRLRKRFSGTEIRFYMCGEYGEKEFRPHYHVCLFGFTFPDGVKFKRAHGGDWLYTSEILSQLWPYGHANYGSVTFESAAYVARYCMKKVTGFNAKEHYKRVDQDTGEIYHLTPEFNKMSLKPGIGARWLEKYRTDVYPSDEVIINGKSVKPPKYYDTIFAKQFPDDAEWLKYERELDALSRSADNTNARLLVKEQVTAARVSNLIRGN